MINKRKLTREEMFLAKPVKNASIRWEKNEKGGAILYIPRDKSKMIDFFSKIVFIPSEKIITLDELGAYMWGLCDGKNSVETIIIELERKFQLNRKEVEVSTLEYLKKLAQRRIIGLVISRNGVNNNG